MSAAAPSDTRLLGLFKKHRLPMPEHVTFGNNILSQMVAVLNADMLAMMPRQWLEFPLTAGHIERIPIKEAIDSPSIVMIRRATLPLTPAAEYFCDLVRRASARMPGRTAGRKTAERSRKPPSGPDSARSGVMRKSDQTDSIDIFWSDRANERIRLSMMYRQRRQAP